MKRRLHMRFVIKGSALRSLVKLLLMVLLVYQGWYVEKHGVIPYFLQILAVLIIGLTCVLNMKKLSGRIRMRLPTVEWFLFGLIAFVTGNFGGNSDIVNDALFTYFSFFSICVCAGILAGDGDVAWISWAMILTTVLCIVSVLFEGYAYKNGSYYAVTMGPDNNPNKLGMMMAIGTFYLLNPQTKPSRLNWVGRLLLACTCGFVVLYSGSRSALLCLLAVVAASLFFRFRNLEGSAVGKTVKRMWLFFFCVVALIFVVLYLQSIGEGTWGINRLLVEFKEESYSGRTRLYRAAWSIFLEHPVFGIGYRCFSSVSSFEYFTHSTYMELLSCTGAVGFLLFMGPVLKGTISAVKTSRTDGGTRLVMMGLFLVGSVFGILYYDLVHMLLLYMTIFNPRNAEKNQPA